MTPSDLPPPQPREIDLALERAIDSGCLSMVFECLKEGAEPSVFNMSYNLFETVIMGYRSDPDYYEKIMHLLLIDGRYVHPPRLLPKLGDRIPQPFFFFFLLLQFFCETLFPIPPWCLTVFVVLFPFFFLTPKPFLYQSLAVFPVRRLILILKFFVWFSATHAAHRAAQRCFFYLCHY